MKIETLKERIEKAQAKIEKKQNTIIKKRARIEKISDKITKEFGIDPKTYNKYNCKEFGQEKGYNLYWDMCDIDNLEDDIERGTREIEETKKTLAKYEAQLAGEIKKESVLIKEIPDSMKMMQTQLVKKWDEWDKERREFIKNEYSKMGYNEFFKKYNMSDYELRYKTDEQIHNANMNDAKMLIINLYYRIKDITGEVTSWEDIYCTNGNMGAVLNGFVIGKEGRAKVESILAGGYNIQRLHVRVLVHGF